MIKKRFTNIMNWNRDRYGKVLTYRRWIERQAVAD
jgi:hypothetical protein